MKLKLLTGVLIAVTIIGSWAIAEQNTKSEEAAKRADIKKLLTMTGTGKLAIQSMSRMITLYKQSYPSVPPKFWTDFMAEVKPDELIELCIPSYEKHFTHDEIKQLIAFYESPIGKKVIQTQPLIMRECMIAGEKWGRKLGEKVAKKLQEEGY